MAPPIRPTPRPIARKILGLPTLPSPPFPTALSELRLPILAAACLSAEQLRVAQRVREILKLRLVAEKLRKALVGT